MFSYTDSELKKIKRTSLVNAERVYKSTFVGCYNCERIYSTKWNMLDGHETILCFYCGVATLIPNVDVQVNSVLLREMNMFCFNFVKSKTT